MINVVLLGAGNVGTNLYKALSNAQGVKLTQWYNRSAINQDDFPITVPTTTQLDAIVTADVYLISVADSAIASISKALENKEGVIAHTAGSVNIECLKNHHNFGVFYPLQTFSKQRKMDFKTIPLCIEANTSENLTLLKSIAAALGGPIHAIDSAQRKALHLAAVFVNNFTNHLYRVGEELCKEHQLPFSILQPLIHETANKIKSLSPSQAQTGPAIRGDQSVIDDHLQYLTQQSHQQLYKLISAAVQKHG